MYFNVFKLINGVDVPVSVHLVELSHMILDKVDLQSVTLF
jgi:hypothetical protein